MYIPPTIGAPSFGVGAGPSTAFVKLYVYGTLSGIPKVKGTRGEPLVRGVWGNFLIQYV